MFVAAQVRNACRQLRATREATAAVGKRADLPMHTAIQHLRAGSSAAGVVRGSARCLAVRGECRSAFSSFGHFSADCNFGVSFTVFP